MSGIKITIKTIYILLAFTLTIHSQLLSADIIVDANTTFITDKDITIGPDNTINIQGDNITFINNHIIKKKNVLFWRRAAIRANINKNIKIFNKNTIESGHSSNSYSFAAGIVLRGNISNSIISNSGNIIGRDLSGRNRIYGQGIIFSGSKTNIYDTSIINSGNILALDHNNNVHSGVGINIDVVNIRNLKIINSGNIINDGEGMHISPDDMKNLQIINSGNIISNRTGIYLTAKDSSNTTIINSGAISSQVALDIYPKANIYNEESGILNGLIYIKNNNSFLYNRGTINIPTRDGWPFSTTPNYTQYATGTLGIKLDIDNNGNSNHSSLQVINKATLADNTNIKVDVSSTDKSSIKFLNKDSLLSGVIFSDNAIDVNTTKLNIKDNSILLNFEASLSNSNKSLDLKAVEDSTISQAVSKSGHNRRLRSVSKILDNIDNKLKNNDMRKFNSYLNTLATNESVANAVTQVTPVSLLSTQSLTTQTTNTMSNVVQARQSSLRGLSSGDIAFSDKNVWIKPFGGHTSQDNKDDINGFSANTFGLGFGIDAEYKSDYRAGLALFYTNADVDTNDVDQSSDINSFSLVTYGSNPIIDDKTNLFYQIGVGLQQTDSSRVITGVGTAKADYTSKNLFFQLKAQREIEINKSFKAKPALLTSYAYYKNPSYSESGVGGLNLEVQEFSAKSFILGIQSDFTYDIDKNTQLLSNLALSYDFYNDAQSINSTFQGGGTVFSTEGIKNDSLIYKAGIGVIKKLKQNFYIDFKYDFDARGTDFQNHVISSRINYKF